VANKDLACLLATPCFREIATPGTGSHGWRYMELVRLNQLRVALTVVQWLRIATRWKSLQILFCLITGEMDGRS